MVAGSATGIGLRVQLSPCSRSSGFVVEGGFGEIQLGADINGLFRPDFERRATGGMRVRSSVNTTVGPGYGAPVDEIPTTGSREGCEDLLNGRRISARIRWS
jgi:hypothetical protein